MQLFLQEAGFREPVVGECCEKTRLVGEGKSVSSLCPRSIHPRRRGMLLRQSASPITNVKNTRFLADREHGASFDRAPVQCM